MAVRRKVLRRSRENDHRIVQPKDAHKVIREREREREKREMGEREMSGQAEGKICKLKLRKQIQRIRKQTSTDRISSVQPRVIFLIL